MNSEERDLIARFIARVSGAENNFTSANTVLPPIDHEADRFIGENFARFPEARYRVTQLAVVQEAALTQAQNRIRNLELQLQQARSQIAQLQQQSSKPSGGFFSSIFGQDRRTSMAPPRPTQAPPGWNGMPLPQQQPMGYGQAPSAPNMGMFGRSGSGFLGSALTTAAGVAGGIMAADAIESLFSDHEGHGGHNSHDGDLGGNMTDSGNETVINNYYGDNSGGDPFAGSGDSVSGFASNDFNDAPISDNNWGSSDSSSSWGSSDSSSDWGSSDSSSDFSDSDF